MDALQVVYRYNLTNCLIHYRVQMDALQELVGAPELHIQMDPHADRLAEEPGCSVGMDALQSSMWMHTDSWSLWMPYCRTYCCTVIQLGCFTMDTHWEDLLVHSHFVNLIVKNGLLRLMLLLLSSHMTPPAILVNSCL